MAAVAEHDAEHGNHAEHGSHAHNPLDPNVLFRHVEKPDFTVRWKWTPGDVAFWDNRAVQHYAVPDYQTERSMQRIMLQGVRPGDTTPVPKARPLAATA